MQKQLVTLAVLLAVVGCNSDKKTYMPGPPKPPPRVPATKPTALDPALREQAKAVINDGLVANAGVIRAHAIEAVKQVMPEQKQSILNGLKDRALGVRYAAAMAVGDLKLADAKPDLIKMAEDRDGRIRAATRYALHRLGDYSRTRDLETLAKDMNPQVRSSAAVAIGLIGEESGLLVLRPMQRDKEGFVRLAVAEAMWRLGDNAGRDTLIGASVSRFSDDQMAGTLALGATRNKEVRGHVYVNLTAEYVEVQLVAARVMGQLDSDAGWPIAMKAVGSKDVRQRQLAALALGAIGRSDSQDALRKLLDDDDQDVQVAAAMGILQLRE
jgi:HEAT repeat protein